MSTKQFGNLLLSTLIASALLGLSGLESQAQSKAPGRAVNNRPVVEEVAAVELMQIEIDDVPQSDAKTDPWWLDRVVAPLRPKARPLELSVDEVLIRAVTHSTKIKVFTDLPMIYEATEGELQAAFDWCAFMNSRWNDLNDPVGNTLIGAFPRYISEQLSDAAGIRRRTRMGGSFEASQQFGFQYSNSIYMSPNPQATSKLVMSYTQPLLRGSGQVYNTSLICLAEIDTKMANAEFSKLLQSHLLEIVRAYWALHIERTNVILKEDSLEQAREVMEHLKPRQGLDAVKSQIDRADAEIATRDNDLIRARGAVRMSEARLRSLVNDPEFENFAQVELVPTDKPIDSTIPVNIRDSLTSAMIYRPEIDRALTQIKGRSIRLEMSRSDMLPLLNAVTQAYVAGLSPGENIPNSWNNQFTTGNPSFSTGLQLEAPVGNRAAKSRFDRRALELRQMQSEYEAVVKKLAYEVAVAVRRVQFADSDRKAQARAVMASLAQQEMIERRWSLIPGEEAQGSLELENLLNAQSRTTRLMQAFVNSWINYNLTLVELKQVTGELLQAQQISWGDYRDECEGVRGRQVFKAGQEIRSTPPTE